MHLIISSCLFMAGEKKRMRAGWFLRTKTTRPLQRLNKEWSILVLTRKDQLSPAEARAHAQMQGKSQEHSAPAYLTSRTLKLPLV